MKRLLAAGAESIYQVTRAFRRDEFGALHNPEFTLVEWYGVGDDMQTGMARLSELAETLLGRGPADRLAYRESFMRYVGVDPWAATAADLAEAARASRLTLPDGMASADRDSWLNLLLAEVVQPNLGVGRPMILHHYPASQGALARICNEDRQAAERFELFCEGVELANGYHELLDAEELADRQRRANEWRRRDGRPTLPENNRLLEAMRAGLPDCCGVALGFDRLVMVALGAQTLADVMPFPFPRA
jgi:lysyl-tRNA synthetase class 2